ncbi:hypothetical protein PsorP6_002189 [Peronosclerospora sorghi]|uniref:Uncharacterized protein n=1 Tax=Peronosclerospora sorghi TaxID=230839 RepID=A0ACC0WS87_9STRA|nr:hypothetical protein PsorP6_002189 [Peronosclerospora sorghi]
MHSPHNNNDKSNKKNAHQYSTSVLWSPDIRMRRGGAVGCVVSVAAVVSSAGYVGCGVSIMGEDSVRFGGSMRYAEAMAVVEAVDRSREGDPPSCRWSGIRPLPPLAGNGRALTSGTPPSPVVISKKKNRHPSTCPNLVRLRTSRKSGR